MPYPEEKRAQIINNFLGWCEKIGYSDPDDPIKVDIVDGLPISVKKAVQSIRFDQLTKSKQNTTMD